MADRIQKGGAFLVEDAGSATSFIPENLSMEQRELVKTVHDFVVNEILPKEDLIESHQPGLMPKLLREAGKLGILGADMPSEYGGLDLGYKDVVAMAEGSTLQGSFNVSFICHTGISTSPLTYYGTEEQKKKYLPRLVTGEMMGAFALTEPDAGSDAMAIRSKVKLSPDKRHYILNGSKHYITNGGFADLITVFAQFEDKGITAFLVEKDFDGITVGKEEEKMGIQGSSTVSLMFDDVKIPLENMLGEPGKGHHIAFNILNLGRLKLGGACTGTSRHLVNVTYKYVTDRVQFDKPLVSFQMVEEKLAMMTARTLLLESLAFRVADVYDRNLEKVKKDGCSPEAALREYTVEASIAKVFGSEALYFVADDAVQLFGGAGYMHEYGIERYYRDCRINRIFEGTNEINRLVIIGTVLRMAAKGEIDIFKIIATLEKDIKSLITAADAKDKMSILYSYIEVLKRLALSVGAAAIQKYTNGIQEEEFILSELSDMIMEVYALESAYMRANQLMKSGNEAKGIAVSVAALFYLLNNAATTLDKGRRVLIRVFSRDAREVDSYLKAMYGCLNFIKGDQQALCMKIMEEIDKAGGYPF